MDAWLVAETTTQGVVAFNIIPFVHEHGRNPGRNGESGKERVLEGECIIDVGRRCHTRDGDAVAGYCGVLSDHGKDLLHEFTQARLTGG